MAKKQNIKRLGFYSGITLSVLTVLFLIFASSQKNAVTSQKHAIVFTPSVTVLSSPTEKSTSLFVIHEGLKVEVLETSGYWHKIKIANGNVGWIKNGTFEWI